MSIVSLPLKASPPNSGMIYPQPVFQPSFVPFAYQYAFPSVVIYSNIPPAWFSVVWWQPFWQNSALPSNSAPVVAPGAPPQTPSPAPGPTKASTPVSPKPDAAPAPSASPGPSPSASSTPPPPQVPPAQATSTASASAPPVPTPLPAVNPVLIAGINRYNWIMNSHFPKVDKYGPEKPLIAFYYLLSPKGKDREEQAKNLKEHKFDKDKLMALRTADQQQAIRDAAADSSNPMHDQAAAIINAAENAPKDPHYHFEKGTDKLPYA
jgi:hypothetical protein